MARTQRVGKGKSGLWTDGVSSPKNILKLSLIIKRFLVKKG